ncbi:unnamed protein product [Arabis nemorensis]|uniref:Uncharacterized protein n=1 Tax=Arabis nemorensis TaxID=586526 RepID=A0A565B7H2_9BRAS|nr:unnamed protein product [Arabis nemorensis]
MTQLGGTRARVERDGCGTLKGTRRVHGLSWDVGHGTGNGGTRDKLGRDAVHVAGGGNNRWQQRSKHRSLCVTVVREGGMRLHV